jgi:hypothetical protein
MTEYEDQCAAMMNFLIRGQAREAVSCKMFMAGLAPELRTRVRKEGYTRARSATAGFILDAICSVILSGGKPVNARLVAAAIRDTGQVNASVMIHSVRSWRRQKTEAAVRLPVPAQALEDIESP